MKKRISILLVLVMVLSMIPMAAFAAPSPVLNAAASTVHAGTTTLSVSTSVANSVYAEVSFFPRNINGEAITGAVTGNVYVTSSRDAEVIQIKNNTLNVWETVSTTGGAIDITTDYNNAGVVLFRVKSAIAGEATISFKNNNTASALLIDKAVFTFTAATASANALELTAMVGTATGKTYADAGTRVTLRSRVTDASNNPLANQTVRFQQRKSATGSWITMGTATTNSLGYATYQVSPTVGGTVYYNSATTTATGVVKQFATGADVAGYEFLWNTLHPVKLELTSAPSVVGTGKTGTFVVVAYDVFGNRTTTFPAGMTPTMTIESKPATSTLTAPGSTDANVALFGANAKAFTLTPDKNGEYTVRISLGSAYFVEKTFVAQLMGDVTEITIKPGSTSLRNGKNTTVAITEKDAAGVTNTPDFENYVIYSSDVTLANTTTAGVVYATTNVLKSGVATITVQHKTKPELKATTEISVSAAPVAIKATPTVTGKTATIALQLVDVNGNNSNADAIVAFDVIQTGLYVLEQTSFAAATGKGQVKVEVPEYGTYTLVVSTKAGDDQTFAGIVGTFAVEFKMPASEKVVIGANSVILTIGGLNAVVDSAVEALDVAPFIQEGRTFVPVRFIAEAFGAEVSFTTNAQGLTETVTLTREDKVVMMTIGTPVITVVENGQTTLIPADVAPTVVSGRTVLPFRALAEAMGAEVSFGMKADNSGVAWVSFAQ